MAYLVAITGGKTLSHDGVSSSSSQNAAGNNPSRRARDHVSSEGWASLSTVAGSSTIYTDGAPSYNFLDDDDRVSMRT
eukprot:2361265-Amphidinium_carterae.1